MALGPHPPAQPASLSWSPAEPWQGWPSCLRDPWGDVVGHSKCLPSFQGPSPASGLGGVMGAVVDGETSHTLIAKINCSPSVSCCYLGVPC